MHEDQPAGVIILNKSFHWQDALIMRHARPNQKDKIATKKINKYLILNNVWIDRPELTIYFPNTAKAEHAEK